MAIVIILKPTKLHTGDEIRVIAPSRSLSVAKDDVIIYAVKYLNDKGYRITFSENCRTIEHDESADIYSKILDLHNAFLDTNVKAIITAIGGFNVNQILEYIDYSIIQKNPKIICGYSDITALLNAIFAKTGLITYHGPHLTSFNSKFDVTNIFDFFQKCLVTDKAYNFSSFVHNNTLTIIQNGEAEGRIIGGNLCTLNLLQGTEFMPKPEDVILFLEDINMSASGDYFVREFERNLQSLIQVIDYRIKGIVFGRFPKNCNMSIERITRIVKDKKQLKSIPIVMNADFGHESPYIAFPIGGIAKITALSSNASIVITEH